MNTLLNYLVRNGIKIIITLKILVVIYVISYTTDLIHIGDRPVIAANGDNQSTDTPTNENSDKLASTETDSSLGSTKRKSFLDDILNLPKIDPDNLKRDEIGRYLGLIEKKKAQVESRLDLLKERESNLKRLESSIDKKIDKLEEEMLFFQQTLQKEKKVKKERLEMLVDFYKKMTPKKAAPVFEQLDRDLVVSLFNRIPKKQVTAILSLMTPERSVNLSEYYGRIRSADEYEFLKQINANLRKEFALCKGMPDEE